MCYWEGKGEQNVGAYFYYLLTWGFIDLRLALAHGPDRRMVRAWVAGMGMRTEKYSERL